MSPPRHVLPGSTHDRAVPPLRGFPASGAEPHEDSDVSPAPRNGNGGALTKGWLLGIVLTIVGALVLIVYGTTLREPIIKTEARVDALEEDVTTLKARTLDISAAATKEDVVAAVKPLQASVEEQRKATAEANRLLTQLVAAQEAEAKAEQRGRWRGGRDNDEPGR